MGNMFLKWPANEETCIRLAAQMNGFLVGSNYSRNNSNFLFRGISTLP